MFKVKVKCDTDILYTFANSMIFCMKLKNFITNDSVISVVL